MADLARLYDFTANTVIASQQVDDELNQLVARINALEPDSLNTVLGEVLGVSQAGAVRRGKSIIATRESRTNPAYGLMPTPDRVQNVVLPTDGLIQIAYQAIWRESVVGAARAAIFIGANQLKVAGSGSSHILQAAAIPAAGSTANFHTPLGTFGGGLASSAADNTANNEVAHPTTGLVVGHFANNEMFEEVAGANVVSTGSKSAGGRCFVFAAAGTYDISVQLKASSGNVEVLERKLWVSTLGF